jgi:multiple antibiotic resistance protein
MVNPLSVLPVYTSLTANLPSSEAKKVAKRANLVAFITMLIFAFGGNLIFDFFKISINGLRIVGGILFFMTGYDLLQAKPTRTKNDEDGSTEFSNDVAITPIGIPLICGPGAITISIVLMKDAADIPQKLFLIGIMAFVIGLTLLLLLGARRVLKTLGDSGNKVMMRLVGIITMVIAVEFLFSGLKPFIRDAIGAR